MEFNDPTSPTPEGYGRARKADAVSLRHATHMPRVMRDSIEYRDGALYTRDFTPALYTRDFTPALYTRDFTPALYTRDFTPALYTRDFTPHHIAPWNVTTPARARYIVTIKPMSCNKRYNLLYVVFDTVYCTPCYPLCHVVRYSMQCIISNTMYHIILRDRI